MKAQGKLGFDEFLTEVEVTQIRSFSNQMKYGGIYQLCITSSLFPTTFHLSRETI